MLHFDPLGSQNVKSVVFIESFSSKCRQFKGKNETFSLTKGNMPTFASLVVSQKKLISRDQMIFGPQPA